MREILSHAEDEYPNELCGVVSGGKYFRCRNAAKDPTKEVVMDKYDTLEFAEKIAIDNKYKTIDLYVDKTNARAISFYTKHGYQKNKSPSSKTFRYIKTL